MPAVKPPLSCLLTVRLFFRQFPRFEPKIGRFRSQEARSCVIILLQDSNQAISIALESQTQLLNQILHLR
jgi:hypothetical protein